MLRATGTTQEDVAGLLMLLLPCRPISVPGLPLLTWWTQQGPATKSALPVLYRLTLFVEEVSYDKLFRYKFDVTSLTDVTEFFQVKTSDYGLQHYIFHVSEIITFFFILLKTSVYVIIAC